MWWWVITLFLWFLLFSMCQSLHVAVNKLVYKLMFCTYIAIISSVSVTELSSEYRSKSAWIYVNLFENNYGFNNGSCVVFCLQNTRSTYWCEYSTCVRAASMPSSTSWVQLVESDAAATSSKKCVPSRDKTKFIKKVWFISISRLISQDIMTQYRAWLKLVSYDYSVWFSDWER